MSHLFDPLTLRGVTLRNRIGMSPMCQYSAQDGIANDWHKIHLGSRAVGGAGLLIVEATAVEPRGRISPGCLGMWSDAHAEAFASAIAFCKSHGVKMGIQLAHAGRKASSHRPWQGSGDVSDADGGWQTVAPSEIRFSDSYRLPHALSVNEIRATQQAFVDAARRAIHAGFDLIEIHAAHGYLLHSFYSPLSNTRTDEYGGSFDNRIRMLIETTRAVRSAIPHSTALSVRLSCTDWTDGGWTLDETAALATKLKGEGVDIIDCSSGGNIATAKVPIGAGYQVTFAEAVRRAADVPTMAVGMISEPTHADEIVRNGRADVVLLARAFLRDPYWAIHAARALGHDIKSLVPPQYVRGY
jgi:2,4-dienoyl-CoA reductase-like NADH-dependent reductase (Old Yellow Enzyme family)